MNKRVLAVLALPMTMATSAYAALPAGVSTAIDAVETDGIELVGLIAAAAAAVYLIAKVLARFGLKL